MGRFFIFLGIILILAGIGLMIAVFAVEDIPFVQDILVERYCEPGEISISAANRLSFSGTQNSTTVWFCDDNEGNQREITDQVGFTAVSVFLVPFLTGIFMIFFGAWTAQRNLTRKAMSSLGLNDMNNVEFYTQTRSNIDRARANMSPEQREMVNQVLQSVSSAFGAPASSSTLAERLQQLEEAYNQGLITSAEYERTRQAILDSMDDNI